MARCGIKALPPELASLSALVELHLPHNLLGGGAHNCHPSVGMFPYFRVLSHTFLWCTTCKSRVCARCWPFFDSDSQKTGCVQRERWCRRCRSSKSLTCHSMGASRCDDQSCCVCLRSCYAHMQHLCCRLCCASDVIEHTQGAPSRSLPALGHHPGLTQMVIVRRYKKLPPGLLQQSALTRLRFLDVPGRTLPPLEPLLQLPNLEQVVCLVSFVAAQWCSLRSVAASRFGTCCTCSRWIDMLAMTALCVVFLMGDTFSRFRAHSRPLIAILSSVHRWVR